jgi:signal transduction histidine kinase/PAS domain-containing protein
MFRTIEHLLVRLSLLLVAAVAGATWLLVAGHLFWGLAAAGVALWLLGRMSRQYKKFNSSVIFLLNALENGDYSFSFAEAAAGKISRERRDVNSILNVIKEILVKARQEEIENEKFLSLIVAAIPTGIVIVDERDFVRVANDAALRLLGMHVFTHVKQLGMVDEAVLHTFRHLAPGRRATIRIADEREERLISVSMSRIRVKRGTLRVVSMHNIAGELEEREMESWIKLIRVMTHEIMNSIAPITSLSETMLTAWAGTPTANLATQNRFQSSEDVQKLERNTVEAFGTITSTARGLLAFVESYRRFTGIPKPNLRPVALGPLVENIVRLEKPGLRERGIEITTRFSDPGLSVAADEGQIAQVLVNLLKNAAEAIPPEGPGGRIEVTLSRGGSGNGVEAGGNGSGFDGGVFGSGASDGVGGGGGEGEGEDDAMTGVSGDDPAGGGGAVTLDVANNGSPVPADVLPHIFVPFFTTKPTGTGIGLSVSRYIMRLHGGNLKHRAEGGLTHFTMTFPATVES